MPTIEDAGLKLARAEEQLNKFRKELGTYLGAGPIRMHRRIEDVGSDKVVHFKIKVISTIPSKLRLLAGECVHSLRSMLDNIVVGLVGPYPLQNDKMLAFPVTARSQGTGTGGAFDEWAKRYLFPSSVLNVLRSLQPFEPYKNMAGVDVSGAAHPATVASNLWNFDKHHAPLTLQAKRLTSVLKLPWGEIAIGADYVFEQLKVFGGAPGHSQEVIIKDGDITKSSLIAIGEEFAYIRFAEGIDPYMAAVDSAVSVYFDPTVVDCGGWAAFETLKETLLFGRLALERLEPLFL